jgi:ABC-type uncharacterized transport system involved in gliding motility auxiliary subunit
MNRSQALLATFAVLAAAFFVNLISGAIPARVDLTADRTFTLSPGSKRIVTQLDEPVTLEFFVSRSDVKLRPYLESYSRRVETLLREYVAASGDKVKLIVTDPRPDTKEEQRAQRHGIAPMRAAQGSAYLGLTAQQADTVKAVPMLDPSRERFLEFDLSKLIASASRLDRPKLAFISSLPISNQIPQGGEQQPGPADLLLAELSQSYEVITLNTTASDRRTTRLRDRPVPAPGRVGFRGRRPALAHPKVLARQHALHDGADGPHGRERSRLAPRLGRQRRPRRCHGRCRQLGLHSQLPRRCRAIPTSLRRG